MAPHILKRKVCNAIENDLSFDSIVLKQAVGTNKGFDYKTNDY